MDHWSLGYVSDISYTYGYYAELNPLRVRLAFLNSGLICPEFGTACEIGFGQGLSTNIHAAATIVQWFGNDFNPSQASFAQELAAAATSKAALYDEAFDTFSNRTDLPEFDFICLHGIWSWISHENRLVIIDFIRRKLKVGGVLYISYNTLPGWANYAPIRHLMTEHADMFGTQGNGIIGKINGALEFSEKLLETNPLFVQANKQVNGFLKDLTTRNKHYLAHEYFNRDWHPMYFSEVANMLQSAKLQFACSANYLDAIDPINLSESQLKFLKEIPDPTFRESVRDYMVNSQFRKDYWVKGSRKITSFEKANALRQQSVVLISYRPDVKLKVVGALGEAALDENIYMPILDFLSDYQARTVAEIEEGIKGNPITFAQLVQAVLLLCGNGIISPAQSYSASSEICKKSELLNLHLMQKAKSSNDINYLSSPVIGGGVVVNRFQQLFLLAIKEGHKQPKEWAYYVHQLLKLQGQKIIKDRSTVESIDQQLKELEFQAEEFSQKRLPILRSLKVY